MFVYLSVMASYMLPVLKHISRYKKFQVLDVWAGEANLILEVSFEGVRAGHISYKGLAFTLFVFCCIVFNTHLLS